MRIRRIFTNDSLSLLCILSIMRPPFSLCNDSHFLFFSGLKQNNNPVLRVFHCLRKCISLQAYTTVASEEV
jgi:hypothetical protein